MAYLEVQSGDQPVPFPLDFDRTVIGEKPGEAVVGTEEARFALTGGDLSDEHAEIRRTPQGTFKVIDLESRHGTRVNGRYVNQQQLADGDEIVLGGVTLIFRAGDAAPGWLTGGPAEPDRAAPAKKKGVPKRAAPADRKAPGRGAPARAGRAAAGAAKAPPVGDRKRRAQRRVADEEEFDEEYDDRADRRQAMANERKRKQTVTIATIVVPVIALLLFLMWQGLKSEGSVNQQVRRQMLAQQNALEWSAMLETAKGAIPDETDHDYVAIKALLVEATENAKRAKDVEKLEAANKAWRDVQVWRQGNWEANDEFVARIDAFLGEYGSLGGAGVDEALKQRYKITGSSGGPAPKTSAEAWQRIESELSLVHETGKYGEALRKLDEFWRDHGAANVALRPKKEAMRKELLEGAQKYFARKLYSAQRNASQGAKGKAARILAQAAETIDMPEYRQKAADEADKLGDL